MADSGPGGLPALFRAGDIGVSSEWRDITYDWAPVLTADGVFIYSYLRDMFDNQRILRPFILDPDGPTKQRIQRILGRRTSWAIEGPEYLLATVGLVHAEVQYGSSGDHERPHHTAATYYVVGRLDHPVLDWNMLERVLDALIVALDPPSTNPLLATRRKDAQAALRSLGHAGMLQNIDPEDLFDPDGAWPSLLPTLIQDPRWTRLFVELHGEAALQPYRQHARAWIEWAQRRATRLMNENRVIASQLLAAQRRTPRGGGHNGAPPQPHGADGFLSGTSADASILSQTDRSVPEGLGVTQTPSVPEMSLASPQGLGVTQTPWEADPQSAREIRAIEPQQRVPGESPQRNQTHVSCWSREGSIHSNGEADDLRSTGTAANDHAPVSNTSRSKQRGIVEPATQEPEITPLVAPHLRDNELSTTRQDAHFWQAVQQILYGDQQRYAYTEGEKKAAYRLFKRTGTPVGVVLAALRAVMCLPNEQCPRRFGDALKLPVFHRCVQQALALVQARPGDESAATWPQFLQSYRSIGRASDLRDVSVPEYHVLKALFERQPDECWEVLRRAEQAAQPPQLSVAYLRRAITNNQQAAALRSMQPDEAALGCPRVSGKKTTRRVPEIQPNESLAIDAHREPRTRGRVPEIQPNESLAIDARRDLLEREGVNPAILTAAITSEQIQAWIVEADARQSEIKDRAAWLAWGIRSGLLPKDHPKLPPSNLVTRRSGGSVPAPLPALTAAPPAIGGGEAQDHQPPEIWQIALSDLRQRLPFSEFETWIKETSLIQVAEQQAIVGTPNIFARDKLAETYAPLIAGTLQTILGFPVQVAVVLDSRLSYCR